MTVFKDLKYIITKRSQDIGKELNQMGGCGTRSFRNISREKIDLALAALEKHGATIIGNNPWNVDTHYCGVKLTAKWDQNTQTIELTVSDSDGSIPCSLIWSFLNNIIAKYG